MIPRVSKPRSGITLTEILISILIMGVGIVSIATLFPLGLIRLRDAARLSRSGYMTEFAAADLGARNLLNKSSFLNPYFSPWYNTIANGGALPNAAGSYDPWIHDINVYPVKDATSIANGAVRTLGAGLPVAYDPLWRYQSSYAGSSGVYLDNSAPECRFANGIGYVRADPDGGAASAHGLQRVTNFNPVVTTGSTVPNIFVSPEDIIFQGGDGTAGAGEASPIVPDMSAGSIVNEWRYTWMFTGQQSDVYNANVFDGDIVVFENRPIGVDAVTTAPFAGGTELDYASGEPVVEAVFGYSSSVLTVGGSYGYGAAAKRVVLLRWPASMPDPDVRVGSWIADVTYERNAALDSSRAYPVNATGAALPVSAYYPYQRCYWYQIIKRTVPDVAVAFNGDNGDFRSMTVWVATDLRAQTLLDSTQSPVSPVHVNAALVAPSVINVFPRTVYTR
ncbi:type IV pilus modification PilV family protein [Singulisphaera rosea]